MMRQGGLFTANMNVEHVAATTQFSGNNERIQATRHNKESPVKQARLAISAKPFANEFGEVDNASIQTKVSMQVELVDRKTKRNVWDGVVEREEPVSSKSVMDVVQSLDRNLQHVVSETAAEIDKFLAAPR